MAEMARALLPEIVQCALENTATGRLAEPEDIAAAVVLLASPAARVITGQVLRVDAGQLIGLKVWPVLARAKPPQTPNQRACASSSASSAAASPRQTIWPRPIRLISSARPSAKFRFCSTSRTVSPLSFSSVSFA